MSSEAGALTLDDIRICLEGAVPGVMATCAADGTPNVAYLSQVDYVDARHVALSFQFFNKTRRNVLEQPGVAILVVHPLTSAMYRVRARYCETQTTGPLFERMKAKLAGIASHTGMAGVFRLLGSDVYEVLGIDHVRKPDLPAPPAGLNHLAALRRCAQALAGAADLDALLDAALDGLRAQFGIGQSMVLLFDAPAQRLYTVASRGYAGSGAGAEIAVGAGVIGVAARERCPIRISHLTSEQAYMQAVRASLGEAVVPAGREIPWPGLPQPRSQLAVPLLALGELTGVLFVESERDMRFGYDDEDALVALGAQLALAMRQLQACGEAAAAEPAPEVPTPGPVVEPVLESGGAPVQVRYYEADGSVFLDHDYLIKGVAGTVLWTLLSDHLAAGRCEFSNRELRLDPRIRLPDISDNLEARLVLLARRLADRQACVRLEKAGRGRLRLCVSRPLVLQALPS